MNKNVLEPFVDAALEGTVFVLTTAVNGVNSVINLIADVTKIIWDINTGNYKYENNDE